MPFPEGKDISVAPNFVPIINSARLKQPVEVTKNCISRDPLSSVGISPEQCYGGPPCDAPPPCFNPCYGGCYGG